MLQIEIPEDKEKIIKYIKALKYALKHDMNPKDKQIHLEALERLEKAYDAI